jgi:N-methylhydantoinase A
MYLGIDIGGTFTDLVLMDDDSIISTSKAPTTPRRGQDSLATIVLDA